jgi:hypothetical protein
LAEAAFAYGTLWGTTKNTYPTETSFKGAPLRDEWGIYIYIYVIPPPPYKLLGGASLALRFFRKLSF